MPFGRNPSNGRPTAEYTVVPTSENDGNRSINTRIAPELKNQMWSLGE
jgi:hypothetical protein